MQRVVRAAAGSGISTYITVVPSPDGRSPEPGCFRVWHSGTGAIVVPVLNPDDFSSLMIGWSSLAFIVLPVLVLMITIAALLYGFSREVGSAVLRRSRNVR